MQLKLGINCKATTCFTAYWKKLPSP